MAQRYGLTAEMYRAIVAIVDDRMKEIQVARQNFDRPAETQRPAEAQTRMEENFQRYEEVSEERWARIEAALVRLAEAQARTEEEFRRYREVSEERWARIEDAQARMEEEFRKYREASEARFARIEAALDRLAEAQARTEARVQALAEAQARMEEEFRKYREASEARFARIEAALDRLAEAQAHTEARVQVLAEAQARTEAQVRALTEAQARTEAQIRALAEAQARTEAQVQALAEAQARMEAQLQRLSDRQGAFQGRLLELTYQQKAGAYFGPLLRRPRAVMPVEIEDQIEGRLSRKEFLDLLTADLLVSGYPRHLAEAPQVWLVVEISATVDRHDVERARRRAGLLRRAGLRAIPAVAGEDATMGARDEAEAHKVLMLQDGQALFWEEALAEALSEKSSGGIE